MLDISYYITDIFDEFNSFGCCFKKKHVHEFAIHVVSYT